MLLKKLLIISIIFWLAGCSGLLPEVNTTIQTPWQSFDEVKISFDNVEPMVTTVDKLKKLGIEPFVTPNVKLLNYLDLVQRFIPNSSITLADLPDAIRSCLAMKEKCQGYEMIPIERNSKRYGNVILDVLNFRRQTKITGWRFQALLVLQEDLVVYKLWSGEPHILEYEDRKNPLGPLQDVGRVLSVFD
ncbi:hypothetical protein [Beggiatoa leptomitoformis]|uniref:Uncharacterized protein n=1 Tax=Beggiatoa leptomitoformis TaxID=288004 RepID=A0A2N9YIJ0_9GAMM|nr:hypothetical protein [Beggiatoa leptomitoformis]ALG67456.1 hypothetical protein AL038_06745 [Beggiatoa leptomitoformis]AUI70327.1 hypothetical protein BLE401_17560 [Beggiatoa leptomitoformis]